MVQNDLTKMRTFLWGHFAVYYLFFKVRGEIFYVSFNKTRIIIQEKKILVKFLNCKIKFYLFVHTWETRNAHGGETPRGETPLEKLRRFPSYLNMYFWITFRRMVNGNAIYLKGFTTFCMVNLQPVFEKRHRQRQQPYRISKFHFYLTSLYCIKYMVWLIYCIM